ncbi:MAG: hypothetical protein LQ346_007557 [Caloplaca aetnensis]|nr:MAG: hypothetical protein LQ346_007557 [Caloplaca aetnensis]
MNSPRNHPPSPPASASSTSTPTSTSAIPNSSSNRVSAERSRTICTGTTSTTSTTRIRDNQRRSRARRKAYLEELEAKVRTYEAQGVEAASEIQAAARKVVEQNQELKEENERLRRLVGEYERRWEEHLRDGAIGTARGEQVSAKGTKSRETGKVDGKRKKMDTDPTEQGKTMCGFGGLKACTGKGCEPDSNAVTPSASTAPAPAPTAQAPAPLSAPAATSPNQSTHPCATSNAYPSPPKSSLSNTCKSPCKKPQPQPQPLPPTPIHPHSSSHSQQSPAILLPPPPPQPTPTPPDSIATSGAFPSSLDDTSSCVFAAHIITSMRSDVSVDQVRSELGCAGKPEACEVDNKRLFTVMDRFA